jgi:hypothetical protein
MHVKVEGDQSRVAYGVQREFFHGEVGADDLVSVGAHGFCVSLAQWRPVRRKARECLHNISHFSCLD